MKRSWLRRKTGLSKVSKSEFSKAVKKLDIALSRMVRDRDKEIGCITCSRKHDTYDAGHFRRRELMSTRFHYQNVNAQGIKENRFEGGRTYEYGLALDKRYGAGTAKKLEKLSREIKQWQIEELEALTVAARMGVNVYNQLYEELTK